MLYLWKDTERVETLFLYTAYLSTFLLSLSLILSTEYYIRLGASYELISPNCISLKSNYEYYVSRTTLERTLNNIIGTLHDEKYVVIVGTKGSGKTTLLNHVIHGKSGTSK
jgi:ABC-type polysaccharide/polyol phosphate transport system ATPase subunit